MLDNISTPFTVNVSDYGAVANSGIDAAEGIRKAIKAASAKGDGSVVKFESGIYLIASVAPETPKDTYHTLYFENLNNITIEGDNTTLLIADPFMDTFYFSHCKSVTIKGFTVDYIVSPWAQGEVVEIDEDSSKFKFKVNNLSVDGRCPLDDSRWLELRTSRCETSPFGTIRDDKNPLLFKRGISNFFYRFTTPKKCEDGIYELGFTHDNYKKWVGTNIKVGTKLVLNNRTDSVGVFRFVYCKSDIKVEDCTVYASNGTIFCIGRIDGGLTIKNVKVLLKEGNWITSNADGMYLSTIKGAVKVSNCIFEGLSDDCMNLYFPGAALTEVISPCKIKVKGIFLPNINDIVTVIDPINGAVRETARVIHKEDLKTGDDIETENTAVITLDSAINGMVAGTTRQDGDVVIEHNAQSPKTEVVNCVFRYGRAKGLKVNAREFTIANNTFEYMAYGAIMLHDIPALSENSGISDCKIYNNKIENSAYLMDWDNEQNAAISVYGMRVDGGDAKGKIHNNLNISSNQISHVTKVGIYVSSSTNVVIENNVIKSDMSDGETVKMGGLTLSNVDGVTVKGLTVNDQRPYLQGGIRLLSNCKNVGLVGNNFNLSENVPEVYNSK